MGNLDGNFPVENREFKPLDPEEFRKQAHQLVDFIADYYTDIETYPVLSQVQPGYLHNHLPEIAPYHPDSLDTIIRDIKTHIIPGMTHWFSPNFFAYFPATGSTAAFLGEMLGTCFNAVGFNWVASPAATELEMVVMDWFGHMLKLPKSFMFSGSGGGVIHNSTTEAVLITLVTARDRALGKIGMHNVSKLVVYGSDQTHSMFPKACKIAGLNPDNIRLLPTTIEAKCSLSPVRLRAALEADVASGLLPLYLCATVGTTSTTAIDPISQLADVATEFGMWVHVDAAYGGNACICPEFRHYLDGIERVDSLSLSPHKWLLTYLNCCCLWVKDRNLLVQALRTDPEYLRNEPSETNSVVDYKDWQVSTSKKFNSIRLWLVFRSYGTFKLQTHIRSDVRMAKLFEGFIISDPSFEIVLPRHFSLVCFRLNPSKSLGLTQVESLNRKLVEWVNSTGRVYITHTIVGGIYMLRFVVGSTLTEERHVIGAWNVIKEGADKVLLNGICDNEEKSLLDSLGR